MVRSMLHRGVSRIPLNRGNQPRGLEPLGKPLNRGRPPREYNYARAQAGGGALAGRVGGRGGGLGVLSTPSPKKTPTLKNLVLKLSANTKNPPKKP